MHGDRVLGVGRAREQGDGVNPRSVRRVGNWAGRSRYSISRRRPIAKSVWNQKVPLEARAAQLGLLCACGRRPVELKVLGCCRLCYQRRYHSMRWFGGLRELILKRDRFKCRACGVGRRLVVHHRDERNAKLLLITLCIRCHVRLHRSRRLRHWVPEVLLGLWRELHPAAPLQLQLPFGVTSVIPTRTLRLRERQESSLDLLAGESGDMDQRLFDTARFIAGIPIKPWQ